MNRCSFHSDDMPFVTEEEVIRANFGRSIWETLSSKYRLDEDRIEKIVTGHCARCHIWFVSTLVLRDEKAL